MTITQKPRKACDSTAYQATLYQKKGIRFLDTTYINKRNSKPHFIDTLRAVLSDSAYRSFMALDTLWQADSVRSSLLTALLRKSRGQNFMLNNHDSLHFLCNSPVIKNYFQENARLYVMYLNNVHEKRPEDLLDGLYSLYSSDVQLYKVFVRHGYYVDSLGYHDISYFKTIADTLDIDTTNCNNDKGCILKRVKSNTTVSQLAYWLDELVPKDTFDRVILDEQDVSNSLYIVATIFSDGEKLFKNHLNETWCQKWNNALTWFGGYLRSILGSYPEKQKLFDTLYHQGPEQGDEFRRVATRHALPTVRYNIEVNLPLSFLKEQAQAYDSTAYQETWDRLKVPRTKWVFNKQDSTYAVPDTHRFCLERGRRQYELTNHTGDVLATITDRKIPVDSDPDSLVDFYRADIITADDYYPFGMQMPSRHWQADSADQYRFGFNGKEKDNAWNGQGNTYNFGARSYAPRLGRNLSPDEYQPFAYPGVTPYSGHNNNPIANVDINGELILYFGGWWPLRGDGEAALDYWNDELIRKTSHKLKDPAVMGFSGSDDIFSEASDRRLAGYLKGLKKAQQIHDQLMRQRKNGDANAKINVVAHSMGAAYSQGFIKALKKPKTPKEMLYSKTVISIQVSYWLRIRLKMLA